MRKFTLLSFCIALQIFALFALGRIVWCQCGAIRVWVGDVVSSHLSQHLFDPYSFSHFEHGLIFLLVLALFKQRSYLSAAIIEILWEIAENSPFVIDRYRTATAALGYTGDSIVNSLGDLIACLLGYVFASRFGWRWSLALFMVIEVGMLALIRDNLILNVLMLLIPIEGIRGWQLAL